MKKIGFVLSICLILPFMMCFSACAPTEPAEHAHTPCIVCGLCTDTDCTGLGQDKCPGHNPPQEHNHTPCDICGKCTDIDCDGTLSEKCQGHTPEHTHTACDTCGKCTDPDCSGEVSEQCAGHEPTTTPLEAVTNVNITSATKTLSFNAVANATEYDIVVKNSLDQVVYTTNSTQNSVVLDHSFAQGNYTCYIVATSTSADYEDSLATTITFMVSKIQVPTITFEENVYSIANLTDNYVVKFNDEIVELDQDNKYTITEDGTLLVTNKGDGGFILDSTVSLSSTYVKVIATYQDVKMALEAKMLSILIVDYDSVLYSVNNVNIDLIDANSGLCFMSFGVGGGRSNYSTSSFYTIYKIDGIQNANSYDEIIENIDNYTYTEENADFDNLARTEDTYAVLNTMFAWAESELLKGYNINDVDWAISSGANSSSRTVYLTTKDRRFLYLRLSMSGSIASAYISSVSKETEIGTYQSLQAKFGEEQENNNFKYRAVRSALEENIRAKVQDLYKDNPKIDIETVSIYNINAENGQVIFTFQHYRNNKPLRYHNLYCGDIYIPDLKYAYSYDYIINNADDFTYKTPRVWRGADLLDEQYHAELLKEASKKQHSNSSVSSYGWDTAQWVFATNFADGWCHIYALLENGDYTSFDFGMSNIEDQSFTFYWDYLHSYPYCKIYEYERATYTSLEEKLAGKAEEPETEQLNLKATYANVEKVLQNEITKYLKTTLSYAMITNLTITEIDVLNKNIGFVYNYGVQKMYGTLECETIDTFESYKDIIENAHILQFKNLKNYEINMAMNLMYDKVATHIQSGKISKFSGYKPIDVAYAIVYENLEDADAYVDQTVIVYMQDGKLITYKIYQENRTTEEVFSNITQGQHTDIKTKLGGISSVPYFVLVSAIKQRIKREYQYIPNIRDINILSIDQSSTVYFTMSIGENQTYSYILKLVDWKPVTSYETLYADLDKYGIVLIDGRPAQYTKNGQLASISVDVAKKALNDKILTGLTSYTKNDVVFAKVSQFSTQSETKYVMFNVTILLKNEKLVTYTITTQTTDKETAIENYLSGGQHSLSNLVVSDYNLLEK